MKYVAKTSLWHTKDEQYIQPGETVDLSHLTKEQVQSLVEMGAIETPAEAKKSAAGFVRLTTRLHLFKGDRSWHKR